MFAENGLQALIKLGQERKDPKLTCAVIFALGNMAATETHARQVEAAGGLAWVQQQLNSPDQEIVRATWGSLSVFAKCVCFVVAVSFIWLYRLVFFARTSLLCFQVSPLRSLTLVLMCNSGTTSRVRRSWMRVG